MLRSDKKGQVTIFIIVALVIIAGILIFFALRGSFSQGVPEEMRPAYDFYLSCVEDHARQGVSLLGEQAGYIEVPDFEPGNAYIPFSNELDFFGQAVPYWMYVSGNNLLKEQVPTKTDMEEQLSDYVETHLTDCDLSEIEAMGYDIYVGDGEVSSSINEQNVGLNVNAPVTIYYNGQSAVVSNSKISFGSKLGKFYDMARDVYDFEKTDIFMEKYAVDVMRLYAPVDGVDISCVPKVFADEEIRRDIYSGLEVNMNSIKLKGDYYHQANEDTDYFVVDTGDNVDEEVNVMYNTNWPTRIEIYGDRIVEPVGIQKGLSMIGFCYVPYHLVYDINFPVMVQFYDSENFFQFPVSVIVDKSQTREALPSTFGEVSFEDEVCKYQNADLNVYTYDSDLNPVEARLEFECLDSVCNLSETKISGSDAVYKGNAPQCINGFIMASAEGYADANYQISTNSESVANIIMRKEYDVSLDLGNIGGTALVSFVSDDYSAVVMYPETDRITLVEGNYNVTVYVYENSALTIPGTSDRMCFDVPAEGVSGLLGIEEEKCYDIDIPSMNVEMAVVGGGRTEEYITEDMLEDSSEINIKVPLFGKPGSLDRLQENYNLAENSGIFLDYE